MEPLKLPVLIFDGNCRLCSGLASWIGTHFQERVSLLESQAIHPATVEALGLDPRRLRASLWWWRQAGWLCLVPPVSWIAAALYKAVAVSRTRLPGVACRTGHCE
ncbi:MAG: hypothetical protein M1115_10810 [Actinobacteria bacterium]|nr:hypothetical protein [Actinomycetota bacterium]